ncbi:MAG: PilN domain-containing protein [Thermodesulfovibrionales bacterium]
MEISLNRNTLQNIKGYSLNTISNINQAFSRIWDFLTISIAHPFIYSGKAVTVSLEHGALWLSYGYGVAGSVRLKNYKSIKIESQEIPKPSEVVSSTISFVRESNINIKEIVLCIPKSLVVTRLATLPISVKDNIADVIKYELDRLTPFNKDEAFFDYKIVKEDAQKITLLISTVKRAVLNPYLEAFQSVGISVRSVSVSINALGTIPRYKDKTDNFTVLNLKSNHCEVGIFQNGRLVSANHTAINPSDDEGKILDAISQLIKRTSVVSPDISSNKQTLYILLNHHTERLLEQIKNKITPYIKVIDTRRENILDFPSLLQADHTSIASLIEALWYKSDGFDLLRSEKKTTSHKPTLSTIILILCLLSIIGAYFFAPVHLERKKIRYLEGLIRQKNPEVKRAETLQKEKDTIIKEITQIEDFKHSKTMSIDIIKEMTNVLPKNAWLTRLRISDKRVEIEGYAASASEILAKLETSKYFEKVEFASPTYRDQSMKMDRFQIKMEIEEQ